MKLLFQLCFLDIDPLIIHKTFPNALMKKDINISKGLHSDVFVLRLSLSPWALLTGSKGLPGSD